MKALNTLVFFALTSAALLANEPQRVRFWAPSIAGAQHQVKFAFAMKVEQTTAVKGKAIKTENQDFAAKLEGVVTESVVNAKGMTKEARFKISKAEYLEDGEIKPMFKEGDEIVVKSGEREQKTEINGQPANKLQAFVIGTVLEMAKDETPTPSEVFDADYPVLPGEKWEVNRNKLVMSWQQNGYPVDSNSTKGTVKFVGPEKYEGKPAHSFEIEYSANAKEYLPFWAPEGTKPINASYEGKLAGIVSSADPNEYGQTKMLSSIRTEYTGQVDDDDEKVEYKGTQTTKLAIQADWQPVK
jgi:hypothetical protein